ncbi:MAG: 50S ribosomal protein L18 [Clostridiales bacterium]|jgi:large subunit ribosomal protein L18|nr:50S ribosomal protein L18 [Clostridiales bacterium]
MINKVSKNKIRTRKHVRVRKKVFGTPERPRLNVYRSLSNMYAQVIDDTTGKTLVSASTLEKTVKEKINNGGNVEGAKEVGKLIAEKASKAGIKQVVFDRGGYIYHGRVKELAEAARESGLDF